MTPQEIYALTERYFGDLGPEVVAEQAAIAMAESGGNAGAINNTAYPDRPGYRPPGPGARPEYSGGIWQINTGPGGNTDLAGYDLSDPEQNAKAARIVRDRQGPRAWSVYTRGTYRQHLPTFTGGAQSSTIAYTEPGADTMTSNYTPTETVAGSSIIDQILKYLDITAGHAGTASAAAGYFDPAALGGDLSSMLPTLARDRFNEETAEAKRQYGLDVARLGLDTARLNYEQRVSAADARYKELSILASQRGPGDSIAYNYALRGLSAPEGTEVNPNQGSQSINQPYTAQIPAAPAPAAAASAPTTIQYDTADPGRAIEAPPEKAAPPAAPASTFSSRPAYEAAIAANKAKTAAAPAPRPAATTAPVAAPTPARAPTIASLPVDQRQLIRMAEGGMAGGNPDGRFIVMGDSENGQPTGNEELLVNPTNAPVAAIPNEAIPPGVVEGGDAAGTPTADEILEMIAGLLQTAGFGGGGGEASGAPVQAAAEGGIFGNKVYSPDEIAGLPSLQAIGGNMNLSAFGGNALDMQMPGTSMKIPWGHQANLTTLSRMHGSERDQLRGAIETPREVGGLGLMWGDWLEAAQRAAPTGASFGAASYG